MSQTPPVNKLQQPTLLGTVFTHFWFKMFGTMAFTVVFFLAYLYLLRHPSGQVSIIPTTWPDRLIGFQPAALPVYLSLWCYVSLPPILMHSRLEIIAYGWRVGSLCLIGLAIFYFWPNAIAPPQIDWRLYPQVAFLKNVDAAGNACPSLHVATAVFSALWLHWRLKQRGLGLALQGLNIAWCLGIAYSTMAVKQHVAIDVMAGTLLALLVAQACQLKSHALTVARTLSD